MAMQAKKRSSKAAAAAGKHHDRDADQFQKLPGDVLTLISSPSSLLPIKQAARTSVLSKQWRNMWKIPPNRHFDSRTPTKFSSAGCPVSQFDSLDDFLSWIDRIVLPIGDAVDDLHVKSLGINFAHGTFEYGWIELNRDDLPAISGYRVVSFKNPNRRLLLGDVFVKRPNLLRHLTLQRCCTETLRRHLIGYDCFLSLNSLILGFVAPIERDFLSLLISCCPSLEVLDLYRCSFVSRQGDNDPRLIVRWRSLKRLALIRCTGLDAGVEVYCGGRRSPNRWWSLPQRAAESESTFYYEPHIDSFIHDETLGVRASDHLFGPVCTPCGQPMPPVGPDEMALWGKELHLNLTG